MERLFVINDKCSGNESRMRLQNCAVYKIVYLAKMLSVHSTFERTSVTGVCLKLVLYIMSNDKVPPNILNCPTCKNNDEVVKIKWGYPTPETLEESKKGNFVLGGCAPYPGIEFSCKKCTNAFGPDAFLEKCPQ